MIGTSLPEYVFIRISIFLLRYATPICLACVLFIIGGMGPARALSEIGSQVAIALLLAYSILDVLYALLIFYPYNRRLRLQAEHPPLRPEEKRLRLFEKVLDNIPDPVQYLRGWFLGADDAHICRENVEEFLSWAFFDRRPRHLYPAERDELGEYVHRLEQRLGRPLNTGRGNIKSFRLTLDDVEVRYRSVIWYLIVGIVDLITHFQLSHHGLQFHAQAKPHSQSIIPSRPQSVFAKKRSISRLSYWYRPHTAENKLPMVFLHGIGIGLWPYVSYLSDLNAGLPKDEAIGIIALEILPVSFRLTSAPLSQADFLSEISLIVENHGWDQFVVVGHSYGTVLATHMLKSPDLNPRIRSIVLIDPVCLLLHLPDVAVNFTRRKPTRANEYLLWYFASMDPGVAHCLGRHFFWKDNLAWKEDLLEVVGQQSGEQWSRKVAVCLAERDLIVDTRTVQQYLVNGKDWTSATKRLEPSNSTDGTMPLTPERVEADNGIEVLWFEGLDHAQVFDWRETTAQLVDLTRRCCEA
ncbi:Alpha/Beta hydrolase protein [Xylariaceae sp. FL0594]|nr:Alpha/Beta hydrolase protein [Xylariaceae sp. FL0594]